MYDIASLPPLIKLPYRPQLPSMGGVGKRRIDQCEAKRLETPNGRSPRSNVLAFNEDGSIKEGYSTNHIENNPEWTRKGTTHTQYPSIAKKVFTHDKSLQDPSSTNPVRYLNDERLGTPLISCTFTPQLPSQRSRSKAFHPYASHLQANKLFPCHFEEDGSDRSGEQSPSSNTYANYRRSRKPPYYKYNKQDTAPTTAAAATSKSSDDDPAGEPPEVIDEEEEHEENESGSNVDISANANNAEQQQAGAGRTEATATVAPFDRHAEGDPFDTNVNSPSVPRVVSCSAWSKSEMIADFEKSSRNRSNLPRPVRTAGRKLYPDFYGVYEEELKHRNATMSQRRRMQQNERKLRDDSIPDFRRKKQAL